MLVAFAMLQDSVSMAARDKQHGPVFLVHVIDGNPGAYCLGRIQVPVGYILMPGHVGGAQLGNRVFAKKVGAGQDQVVAIDACNRIQEPLVRRQFPDECIFLLLGHDPFLRVFFSKFLFQLVKGTPAWVYLCLAINIQREHVTLLVKVGV